MLGQFQITEITERVEANVRRPFSGRIRAEGRDQLAETADKGRERGRGGEGIVGIPIFTKYEI